MQERELAECIKKKIIIGMGLTIARMDRLFSAGSKGKIIAKVEEVCSDLAQAETRDDYRALHHLFCKWFVAHIRTAEKKQKDDGIRPSRAASYGQAAKVLDVVLKVYFYYCGQPSLDKAEKLVPFLNGAIDTKILHYLKKEYPNTNLAASTIKQVDEKSYSTLQELVIKDVHNTFHSEIYPVEYDDIMWYYLNRCEPSNLEPQKDCQAVERILDSHLAAMGAY